MKDEIIDFIVTWVDDSDEEWQAQKASYSPNKDNDVKSARYRDMNLMRYWFRGVEKFAPWVNKIHFVTCGHYPKWLNLSHPKLNFVKHSDYVPQKYLPTFNSNSIELNFNRIKDLSEKFILFNDDMFILKSVNKKDYFKKNIPCDQAFMTHFTPMLNWHDRQPCPNNIAVINKHFNKTSIIKKHLSKWFNINYKIKSNFINLLNVWNPKFSYIYEPHLLVAYNKSEFESIWKIEPELVNQTCLNKFRDRDDVSHFLIRHFRIMNGKFKPSPVLGKYFLLNDSNYMQICNDIKKQAYKTICINDNGDAKDFKTATKLISEAFNTILPEKSEFEIY